MFEQKDLDVLRILESEELTETLDSKEREDYAVFLSKLLKKVVFSVDCKHIKVREFSLDVEGITYLLVTCKSCEKKLSLYKLY